MERKCGTCAAWLPPPDLGPIRQWGQCCLHPSPIAKDADMFCMQYVPKREGLKECCKKPPEIDSNQLAQRIWNRLNYIPIDDLRSFKTQLVIKSAIDDYLKELKEK